MGLEAIYFEWFLNLQVVKLSFRTSKSRLNGFSVVIVKPMQADRASIAE